MEGRKRLKNQAPNFIASSLTEEERIASNMPVDVLESGKEMVVGEV